MSLTIDKDNYSIKVRSGDSGVLIFQFNIPLDNFKVDFCIEEELNSSKTKPVIQKCYKNLTGNFLAIRLTSEETETLKTEGNFLGKYYWGLRIHNDDGYAKTLIPDKYNKRPKFFVYPKIGGCKDE